MKSLFSKLGTFFAALAAIIGINFNGTNVTALSNSMNRNNHQIIAESEVTEQTPLYLYHSNQLLENSYLRSWHYSHYSHRSHYSHYSHRSHYSHYSG